LEGTGKGLSAGKKFKLQTVIFFARIG